MSKGYLGVSDVTTGGRDSENCKTDGPKFVVVVTGDRCVAGKIDSEETRVETVEDCWFSHEICQCTDRTGERGFGKGDHATTSDCAWTVVLGANKDFVGGRETGVSTGSTRVVSVGVSTVTCGGAFTRVGRGHDGDHQGS